MGPFEARHDGRLVDLGIRRQERCLLAVLLLEPDRGVSVTRLIDLLWAGHAPESARGTVQTYVGRLRHALEPYGVRVVTRSDGYAVDSAECVVDVQEFRRLANQAAEVGDPGERVRLLDRALELWRGPLLPDMGDESPNRRIGATIVEQRLASIELRAEAQLRLGLHDRVVTELHPLVTESPTRERLVAQVMTALYRCGRPADALALFRETRHVLVDELGIEPGAELQTLHQRMLRHDAELGQWNASTYVVRVRGEVLPWNVGGHPALDFCNTYAGWEHRPPLPRAEWLRRYSTLAVWAGHMGMIDDETTTSLVDAARRRPDAAAEVLDEARVLRANLRACLVNTGDRDAFRAVAHRADDAARVSAFDIDDDGLGRWVLSADAGLQLPLHAAAWAGAELLADARRFTVRRCPSAECGWLFLDQSGLRRWCSMSTCGCGGNDA